MSWRRPAAWTFALGVLVGFGAMGWVTREALRSDRAEQAAQARVLLEGRVRQALAGMDATMGLFLAPESARPWSHYDPIQPSGAPSPLIFRDDPLVKLRFQATVPDRLTILPVAPGKALRAAGVKAVDPARLRTAEEGLRLLRDRLDPETLKAGMATRGAFLLTRDQMEDYRSRSRREGLRPPFITQGGWVPFWSGDELLLVRQVWVEDEERLQGCWMDADGVREVLLSVIRGYLPHADLRPALGRPSPDRILLGSLPFELVPGEHFPATWPARRATRLGLGFGWACVVLGVLAGAWAMARAVLQGERRAALAASVTHELRTPLTTFRLYTELLAKDMVPDEAARRDLIRSLAEEADRIDHLVKNMLAYARLESRRDGNRVEVPLSDLLSQVAPRLQARAEQSNLPFLVTVDPAVADPVVSVDLLVVEQILGNLVDNACKYGGGELALEALPDRWGVALRLRDHGPGLPPSEQRHLFDPFHRSRHASARTAPGVGLGLALSRRLAQSLGGDLEWDRTVGDGAAFRLLLPAVGR